MFARGISSVRRIGASATRVTRIPRSHAVNFSSALSSCLTVPRTVAVIGAPISLGQPLEGVDKGPKTIRDAGLLHQITQLDWRIVNRGDLKFNPSTEETDGRIKFSKAVGEANKIICDAVESDAKKGYYCLSLGGDHSIAIGTISGILKARPNTGVIWVDAHTDINTHLTTLSGNIHGMAVAFLMGLSDIRTLNGFHWMKSVPVLDKKDIVYIASRDLDSGEKQIIKSMNIKAFTMHDIDRHGIGKVMEMVLDHISGKTDRPLHLSVDIDSVDPFLAPSTGTKVRGGLTFREANYICESVFESGHLGSVDLVELNPYLHAPGMTDDMTVDMAIQMITSALGKKIL